ncbi:MAG: hypothetical protein BTN85_1950 [Candidatus Methanohalarchaeum thermophilum]|uniref:Uncharacterized protein n=1 Tax=Methanohalarchaeum thermophilum TaxID=1903181 RepID=A0A1Q6DSE6_METT1|nr:MAG: hypothetical protein BTN85_1950 [Candidatus Methanohalarchaeum thermophilum]
MDLRGLKYSNISLATLLGFISTLVLGLVENSPSIGIPEIEYYGYPLVWRTSVIFRQQEIFWSNFFLDLVFWAAIFYLLIFLFNRFKSRKSNFLALILVVFLASFFMCAVHEFGHVFWGLIGGGELSYLKIGFVELYPGIRLVSEFKLGKVLFSGFESDFGRGIYLLGGSLSTNLVSWFFAVFSRRNMFFWVSGVVGLLDLPLYVFLPQLGIRHWVFLGGVSAEPLVGARILGVPDVLFYFLVVFSTVALFAIYFGGFFTFFGSD